MKKSITFFMAIITLLCLCACGEKEKTEHVPQSDARTDNAERSTEQTKSVDLDLTKMNSTMVYSTVYDMIYDPDKYVGKCVKMAGPFNVAYSSSTGLYYPSVIISDATACCQQGMEFVLKGDPSYPDSYPQKGKTVTVIGTFQKYYEGTKEYVHLINSVLV